MAYKALYRTYRPQTFEEVAGQQHIVKTLKNALATGRIAHAYLFAGPRGTGKTTMAKLFAKALNCENGIGEQCNECKNCKAIIEGNHPDVLELDAASNNGVDEIRDLIDKVKYGTILGKYKVYIIDEVHMLSTGAFNALLKTLEEPPKHVIFILATTEPHKILPTILSRCQRYDFEKVSDKDIKERIRTILEQEQIPFNDEAISLIIKLADGGMRDALSILEKVLAYSGKQLNVKDVLDIFSLESTEEKVSLLKSIIQGNISDVLERINKYIQNGSDIKRLSEDLLNILKDILIYNSSNNVNFLDSLKADEINQIAPYVSNDDAVAMIDILMDAIKNFKNVTSLVPLFEITLLKMTNLHSNKQIKKPTIEEHVFETKEEIKPAPAPIKVEPEPVKVEKEPEPVKPIEKPVVEEKVEPVFLKATKLDENVIYLKDSDKEDTFEIDDDQIINIMVSSKKEIKASLLDQWKNIKRYTTDSLLGKAAGLLIDGRPLVASPKMVILEFPLKTTVNKVNLKENQLEIQSVFSTVFGKKMFVYAISRNQSVDLQSKYMNLLQIGQLPKAKDITLEFEGE
ncbi:MAG: DNA polymerase III subunit gamma/tau [Bacilli bacterium]|nr:DNA polymerase III subunit gamma/tau [Bacilli bacterium]